MEQGSVGLGVSRCVIFTGRVCFSNKPPLPHHPPPPLYLDLCSTILVARSTTGLALSFTVSMSRDIVLSVVVKDGKDGRGLKPENLGPKF